ncbi:BNR repeat domain protein [hydrothermal vent metagenome]|uniref:BNR repeat domain protein n=1 Tax=hydrothermal vent metagenome TaxID=652676 RepID=A0A3B1BXD2_9ZZZZ
MVLDSLLKVLAFARGSFFNAFLSPVIAMAVLATIAFPSTSLSLELPRIAAGFSHSVVIKNDGTLRAWGSNNAGQLGDGSNANRYFPVSVSGLSGSVVAVSAGARHTVALLANGTVWAWGANDMGQLGNGTTANSPVPVMVHGASGVVFIVAGLNHTLALRNDGSVIAWGDNSQGQLGAGGMKMAISPVSVSISGVAEVAVGDYHSYALKADGSAWTWGAKMHESATKKSAFNLAPVALSRWSDRLVHEVKTINIPGTGEKVYVISNLMHSVMLRSNGDVYTAGSGMGRLGKKSDFGTMSKVEWAGGVTAHITPDSALFAGARWRVNGGEWHAGGDTVSGLSTGDYNIEFTGVAGWSPPVVHVVSVKEGDISFVSGVYTFKTAKGTGDATKTANVFSSITTGSSVSGSISNPGGTEGYSFNASAGAKYVIRASGLKGAYVKVYSADGVMLLAHSSGATLTWIAPSSGAFKIEIGASGVATVGEFDLAIVWRPAVMDFNGDSKSDITFRDLTDGTTFVWMMDGTNILSDAQTTMHAGDATGWKIKGFDDFNGDGLADILWWDEESGKVSIWFMNGATVAGDSGLATSQITLDSDLEIAGTGDFNGDGKSDVMWSGDTGLVTVWMMVGGSGQVNDTLVTCPALGDCVPIGNNGE